jgi:prophage regulatory protein
MTTRLMRLAEVAKMTGLPRSSIYAMIAKGFPAPIKLSERASAWRWDEISDWIEERTRQSRPGRAAP